VSKGKGHKARPNIPKKKTAQCALCVEAQGIIKGTRPESWGRTVGWAWDHIDTCKTEYAAQIKRKMRASTPKIHFVKKG
jgi:hypothetical protein